MTSCVLLHLYFDCRQPVSVHRDVYLVKLLLFLIYGPLCLYMFYRLFDYGVWYAEAYGAVTFVASVAAIGAARLRGWSGHSHSLKRADAKTLIFNLCIYIYIYIYIHTYVSCIRPPCQLTPAVGRTHVN
jgi:hypothetical protein